jgi:hypothetical protein
MTHSFKSNITQLLSLLLVKYVENNGQNTRFVNTWSGNYITKNVSEWNRESIIKTITVTFHKGISCKFLLCVFNFKVIQWEKYLISRHNVQRVLKADFLSTLIKFARKCYLPRITRLNIDNLAKKMSFIPNFILLLYWFHD